MIVSAGYRIGPFEVESALVAHPAVAEAAAVAAPDEERGAVVRAVVVLREGAHAPSPELARELQEHVKRETAPYKYPRIVEFARRAAEDRQRQGQAGRSCGPRAASRPAARAQASCSAVCVLTLARPKSLSSSSTSCATVLAGGRSTRKAARMPTGDEHRRHHVGEVVAAGQRAGQRVPAGAQRLGVVGRDRAQRGQADRAEQLDRDVDDPRGQARVPRGRVGHADRQQRQERRARAEPEQQEGEEQAGEVARVDALHGEQQQADDDPGEPARQRRAPRRSAPPAAPRRPST